MKNKYYRTLKSFARNILLAYTTLKEKDEYALVTVIGKYDSIRELFRIMCCSGFIPSFAQLEDKEWNGYCDEFILSLFGDEVSVEKMKHDDVFYSTGGDVIYVLDECNSKVLSKCDSKDIRTVSIRDDFDTTAGVDYSFDILLDMLMEL